MKNQKNTHKKGKKGRKPLSVKNIETRIRVFNHAIDSLNNFRVNNPIDGMQLDACKRKIFSLLDQYEVKLESLNNNTDNSDQIHNQEEKEDSFTEE